MVHRSNTSKWLFRGSVPLYMTAYLLAVGDIGIGRYGWQWQVVESPFTRMLELRGAFQFEAIALAELGGLILLISPGNLLIAGILGCLLALNINGALDLRDRADCPVPGKAGVSVGGIPALLAGGACCAPSILMLIGLPGVGAFISLFAWLIPLSVFLLAASRFWQRRIGATPVLGIL